MPRAGDADELRGLGRSGQGGLFARKYYARGIGTILEVENAGEVVQLVKCNFNSRCANLPMP